MLNGILISGFHRYCHTDILSIRNLILSIILQIPKFKLKGLKNHCICFICKLVAVPTGNSELHIPGQINTTYCNSVTGVVYLGTRFFFLFSKIILGLCRTVVLLIRFHRIIKNIILCFFIFCWSFLRLQFSLYFFWFFCFLFSFFSLFFRSFWFFRFRSY